MGKVNLGIINYGTVSKKKSMPQMCGAFHDLLWRFNFRLSLLWTTAGTLSPQEFSFLTESPPSLLYYTILKTFFDLQKLLINRMFWDHHKFLSVGKSGANPMGSSWQSIHFICDWETKIKISKTLSRIGLSWNLENIYPPKGKCLGTPDGVQLISLDLN